MSSSMRLLNDPISRHGLVVIPKQQITGIGKTIFFKFIFTRMKIFFNVFEFKKAYSHIYLAINFHIINIYIFCFK